MVFVVVIIRPGDQVVGGVGVVKAKGIVCGRLLVPKHKIFEGGRLDNESSTVLMFFVGQKSGRSASLCYAHDIISTHGQ